MKERKKTRKKRNKRTRNGAFFRGVVGWKYFSFAQEKTPQSNTDWGG
jgi:hypothetical protein